MVLFLRFLRLPVVAVWHQYLVGLGGNRSAQLFLQAFVCARRVGYSEEDLFEQPHVRLSLIQLQTSRPEDSSVSSYTASLVSLSAMAEAQNFPARRWAWECYSTRCQGPAMSALHELLARDSSALQLCAGAVLRRKTRPPYGIGPMFSSSGSFKALAIYGKSCSSSFHPKAKAAAAVSAAWGNGKWTRCLYCLVVHLTGRPALKTSPT